MRKLLRSGGAELHPFRWAMAIVEHDAHGEKSGGAWHRGVGGF